MIIYRRLGPIQAITFDLDDTLYENSSVIRRAEASLVAFLHSEYPQTAEFDKYAWRRIQGQILAAQPELKNDMGQLRFNTLEQGLLQLGVAPDMAMKGAKQGFEHFYHARSDFVLDPSMHHILQMLSDKLPLVAITNGNVNLEQIGIDKYFSATFKASLQLPMKPSVAMFDAAKNHLSLAAKQILHVGDNLEKDVHGAINAGFQAAWYADDRQMNLNDEATTILPHVQLNRLKDLLDLIF
jgi:putative hydrolase of the HAD superfamily